MPDPHSAPPAGDVSLLKGITVLDFTQVYNGPYATFLMAKAGADIIKIEPPAGEPLRKRAGVGGAALPFAMLNGNKRSLMLDLKTAAGRDEVLRLAAKADVVVENFTPGTMERLGIGPDTLLTINNRLIYARGSGYGQAGEYRDLPAMDLTIQAMSGMMSVTGFPDKPPVKAGPAVTDFLAGLHLYGGIATALYARERSGHGQVLEVAMLDAVYATLGSNLGLLLNGQDREALRTGNRHGGLAEAPYNVYETSDGHIAIICVGEEQWSRLLAAMGRQDLAADPRLLTLRERVQHIDLVDGIVEGFTRQWTKQALFALLRQHRVPCAPVRSLREVMSDQHLHERGMLQWFDHPELGRIVICDSPIRYEGVPSVRAKPSPRLGQHTAEILGHE